MRVPHILVAVSLLVLACQDNLSGPADGFVYASPSGSDAAPGTRASPKRTVAAAMDAAIGRSGVRLLPGRYAPSTNGEHFPIAPPSNVLIEAADTTAPVVLDAEGSAGVLRMVDRFDVILRRLTLTGGAAEDGGGLHVSGGSVRGEVLVIVGNSATRDGSGVFLARGHLALVRSVVASNTSAGGADAHGIHIVDGTAQVHNNVVALHDSNGLLVRGSGIADIRSNIFYRNGQVTPAPRGRGICEVSDPRRSVIRYNLFFGNVSAPLLVGLNDVTTEEANDASATDGIEFNLAGDPLFVNADAGNFRLLPGSPAINMGEADASFNDRDGSRNDIGYTGGP